jgi:hypothetical protein
MKNRKTFILILLLSIATVAGAQIKIPETNVSFNFPSKGWKYLQTSKPSNNSVIYLYSYSGDYVIDSQGDTIIPFLRIYVRKNYDGTVYDLAYSRFMVQPFQSLDEKLHSNGILEYLGAYTNEDDGKDYEFKMAYVKDRNTMLEIRLECTVDNFDDFDKDFTDIINSIKIN